MTLYMDNNLLLLTLIQTHGQRSLWRIMVAIVAKPQQNYDLGRINPRHTTLKERKIWANQVVKEELDQPLKTFH